MIRLIRSRLNTYMTTAFAVAMAIAIGAAHATPGGSQGSTETSDSLCEGLTPTIYVENDRIVGGPDDGRKYRRNIRGTSGDDIIFGTDRRDNVLANGGNDIICGFEGDDRIYAQFAKITAYGGLGDDKLFGGKAADVLSGGSGTDVVFGGDGDDTLLGGSGRDWLLGKNGDDILDGGADDDVLFGGRGNDILEGGANYDRLYGGPDNDTCTGEVKRSCENEISTITVVDVISLNTDAAVAALSPLSASISTAFDTSTVAGLVIAQTPASGTEVALDTTVDLVVSKGPSSVLAGRVTNPVGEVLSGITVSAINNTDTESGAVGETGLDGMFSLEVGAAASFTIQLSADDYADQVVIINSPVSGKVALDVTMISRDVRQSFNEDEGATITGLMGAQVKLNPNSFVEGTDTGDIQVSITPLDVSNLSTLAAFPGDFSGTSNTGSTGPIVPLGTVEFEFSDANGNPLDLLEGQTADIEIPIFIDTYPNGSPVLVDQRIALWSLNEETGIWVQEDFGTVVNSDDSPTGLALAATVSHFSWWNCDVSINPARANITVLGTDNGTALVNANALDLVNWRGTGVQSSPIAVPGTVSGLFIPSDVDVCYSAAVNYLDGTSGTTNQICQRAGTNATIDVVLNAASEGQMTELVTLPRSVGNTVIVTAFSTVPAPRVTLLPNTAETAVSYSIIAGSLPAGFSLKQIDSVRAEIVGTSAEPVDFTVTVQGLAGNESASVDVRYIIGGEPPPDIRVTNITLDPGPRGFLYYDLFLVEPADVTRWVFDPVPPAVIRIGQEAPGYYVISSGDIVPPYTGGEEFWYTGTLTAIGSGGADSTNIRILFQGVPR